MRITGPNQIRRPQGKATSRKAGSATGFRPAGRPAARPAASGQGPASITRIDSLIALQSADSDRRRRRRAVERGEDLLDQLEGLKLDILSGTLPVSRLRYLAAIVERKRSQAEDPHLAALLDEIDLRAQVELAKHRRS